MAGLHATQARCARILSSGVLLLLPPLQAHGRMIAPLWCLLVSAGNQQRTSAAAPIQTGQTYQSATACLATKVTVLADLCRSQMLPGCSPSGAACRPCTRPRTACPVPAHPAAPPAHPLQLQSADCAQQRCSKQQLVLGQGVASERAAAWDGMGAGPLIGPGGRSGAGLMLNAVATEDVAGTSIDQRR